MGGGGASCATCPIKQLGYTVKPVPKIKRESRSGSIRATIHLLEGLIDELRANRPFTAYILSIAKLSLEENSESSLPH